MLLLPRNVTLQQFKSPLHTDDITIKEFEESQNYGSGNLRSDYKSTFYGVRDESHSTKFQGDYSRKRISLLKDRLLRAKSSVIGPFKQPLSPRVEAKKFDASLVKGLTSEATVRFISTVDKTSPYNNTHHNLNTSSVSSQISEKEGRRELYHDGDTNQHNQSKVKLMNIIVLENEIAQEENSEISGYIGKADLGKASRQELEEPKLPSSPELRGMKFSESAKGRFRSIMSLSKQQGDFLYGSSEKTVTKTGTNQDKKSSSQLIFLQKPKKSTMRFGAQLKQKWESATVETGCNPYSVNTSNSKIEATASKLNLQNVGNMSTDNNGAVSQINDISERNCQPMANLRRERSHDPRVPSSLGNTLSRQSGGGLDNWVLSARGKVLKSNVPVRCKYGGLQSQKSVATNNPNTSRHSGLSSERHLALRKPSIMMFAQDRRVVFDQTAKVKQYVPDSEIS